MAITVSILQKKITRARLYKKLSNFHFDISFNLSDGEVHDFSGEVHDFSGKVQKNLKGGAKRSRGRGLRTSPQNPAMQKHTPKFLYTPFVRIYRCRQQRQRYMDSAMACHRLPQEWFVMRLPDQRQGT